MKLVCASFGLEMELLENYVTVLVVENAGYLTEIVSSLKKQSEGSEGEEGIFVLAENYKIEKIDKKLALVIDPFSISINERKIINKLYTKLGEIAPDYFEDKAKLTEDAIVLLDKLVLASPFANLVYDLDYNWMELFKGFNVRFEEMAVTLVEKLVEYMHILTNLLGIKVLCLVNIKAYLNKQELIELYKVAFYNKINLVLIEMTEGEVIGEEKVYIIDNDRCLIVK